MNFGMHPAVLKKTKIRNYLEWCMLPKIIRSRMQKVGHCKHSDNFNTTSIPVTTTFDPIVFLIWVLLW